MQQFSTRTSNVTRRQTPQNEVFVDHPDENLNNQESSEDSSESSEEEEEEEEEVEEEEAPVSSDLQQEQEAKQAREAEYTVIEGPSEGRVLIRLKFLSDTEKDTWARLEDTVATFKAEHFTDLTNKVIRLIYQGQLLRDETKTLRDYGIQGGCVVHCHISMVPLTRPGVPTLPPIVNEGPRRRRRDPEEIARRRAVQDRNVGQIYLLLSTMVPILSGIGLAFFRPDRIRDVLRPATLLTISQWVCNLLVDNGLLEQDEEEVEMHQTLQTSTLFWIFGGQMVAVSIFLYYFPDVFDRVGFSIFIIVFLYFVFVVYSRQRRRQHQPEIEIIENQIIQETISLL
uniref:Ubiquitin-like domain-containing protein n=1 Tax=Caenorhabditis tropicalis TaxID=1561998 RepID=A0A1I7V557_9PELO